MPRYRSIPPSLVHRPFTTDDARLAGLSLDRLKGGAFRRVGPRTYVTARVPHTPLLVLVAALRRLPPEAAFSGLTAAWLHGLDAEPCNPVEATVPKLGGVSARAAVALRRADLEVDEVVVRHGVRATSITRTLCDVGRRLPITESVVLMDAALHAGVVTISDLDAWLVRHSRWPGTARLRRAIRNVEPRAESPMETRLRLTLVLNGLPRPEAQVSIHDDTGAFLGRPDLLYREQRVAIEYDGTGHREQLTADNRRQNRLVNAGFRLLRFTAPDVLNTPSAVLDAVRIALAA